MAVRPGFQYDQMDVKPKGSWAPLRCRGPVEVWYDEFSLTIGDTLRRKIDRGLIACRFGVVVLSPAFFGKGWPNYELDGLVTREVAGSRQLILPAFWASAGSRQHDR